MKIPFNKPFLTGKETLYIEESVKNGHISGNGIFTKKCQTFFEERYGFNKTLLTTSCTDALEMCSMLINVEPGDEIIVPSYTFVSTVLAFTRQGARILFADSSVDSPNIDANIIENLVTPRTKAIVVVHYAGVAVDMDKIMAVAKKHNLFVIEDAAQAIESFYKGKPLGSIGHLATFSFHETKNIISGEGGLLVVNDESMLERAEILWEKGTNRSSFFRGEVNKYGWVDTGSSFLPSEIIAAFLYAQLEHLEEIQQKRKLIWETYKNGLKCLEDIIRLPLVPHYATNNAHMFYIICSSEQERTALIAYLKKHGIHSVFHYLSLHKSPYFLSYSTDRFDLPNADLYTSRLLRLPFYYDLEISQATFIIKKIVEFYRIKERRKR